MAARKRPTVEIHGYALRVIRERSGIKIADLATSLNVTRTYLVHLEVGSKRRVSVDFYVALLSALAIEDYRALLAVAPGKGEVVPELDGEVA